MKRKRIHIIIICLLSFSLLTKAQEDQKIVGPMAALPARDFHQLDMTIAKLADLKEEELIGLATLLKPAAEGANATTEYALSGLTGYVSSPGKDPLRKKVALAYAKALSVNKDSEAQSFILSQLQSIAHDESIPYIAPLLSDSRLVDPASRALVGIGSDAAKKALTVALVDAKQENAAFLLGALGYLKEVKALSTITSYANSKNANIRKAAYFALASIGDPSSADLLTKIADESNYRFDETQAFGSYLNYIKNLSTKDKALAEQLATDLMRKVGSHEVQARIAALTLLVDLQKEKSLPLLEAAFNDLDKTYRVAALKLASPYMNATHADLWTKLLRNSSPELKIELMESLATKDIPSALPAIKVLMTSLNTDVKEAAIIAAGRLGGEAVLPDFLVLLKKGEAKEIAAVKKAFLTIRSKDVNAKLKEVLPTLPWASKATVLSILDNGGSKESTQVYPVKEFNAEVEKKEGFHILFDGTDMDQWTGNTKDYTIEYGEMVINPSKGSGGNLYTKEEFSDFIFRFEFKLSAGANNGLGVRAPLKGDAAYEGIEIQIIDNDAEKYKYLKPYQYHGSLYGIMEAKKGFLNPIGMWNYQEVQVKGDHFKVILNGNVILDDSIADAKANGTLDSKEHPGLFRTSGHIAFLGHGDQMYFRNIRVKKL